MKKKFVTSILTLALTLAMCVPCLANTYSEDGSASCTVTATVASTYTVSIPATLSLADADGDNVFTGEYTVGCKGNIAAQEAVLVIPVESFDMQAQGSSDKVTATVSQPIYSFTGSAGPLEVTKQIALGETGKTSFVETTGTVSCTITQAEEYTGNLRFDFALKSVYDTSIN